MIAIVDYGAGNLKSVSKALEGLGFKTIITGDPGVIGNSKALVLPGVGAFGLAMEKLRQEKLDICIADYALRGKPVLGICLGMQLLYERSYEDGECKGLGLLKGEIVRLCGGLKVPHMGWNKLVSGNSDFICRGLDQDPYVYFVHSYYLKPQQPNEVVLWTEYGTMVPAVVKKNNLVGMQFHPEKSGATGIKLLENFCRMVA